MILNKEETPELYNLIDSTIDIYLEEEKKENARNSKNQ